MSAMIPPQRSHRRGWSDDQLRVAVSHNKSWRAVARALGLRATSTHNVRRHAARLRLDVSHFTGRRRWTDRQLTEAVMSAFSWRDVLQRLGTDHDRQALLRAKGDAIRLSLEVAHLSTPEPTPPSSAVPHPPPRREQLRAAATSIAAAWFALRGYPAALPTEPQAYDLLVNLPEGISRVQVKSTTCKVGNGRWLTKVGTRPYSRSQTAGHAPYDPDAIDFYFVITGDGALYLLPSHVLAGRTRVYIDSYRTYLVGDASSLLAFEV